MAIIFATSSDGKLAEVQRIMRHPVQKMTVHLVEPQEVQLEAVVIAKAHQAYEKLLTPVIVDDSGLFISAWNGLPGALAKWFIQRLGQEGICALLNQSSTREATAQTAVVYHDGRARLFMGSVKGRISDKPRGSRGFGFDNVFIPEGSEKTFGEMEPAEKDYFSMRRLALDSLMADRYVARKLRDDLDL